MPPLDAALAASSADYDVLTHAWMLENAGEDPPFGEQAGRVGGFSLHAGVAARADQRDKLERLCRYISRPAVSEKRLSLTTNGLVRYQPKTPYRAGATHVF